VHTLAYIEVCSEEWGVVKAGWGCILPMCVLAHHPSVNFTDQGGGLLPHSTDLVYTLCTHSFALPLICGRFEFHFV
jgi:hypothetical protein